MEGAGVPDEKVDVLAARKCSLSFCGLFNDLLCCFCFLSTILFFYLSLFSCFVKDFSQELSLKQKTGRNCGKRRISRKQEIM